jgi:hypothetical protein
MSKVRMRKVDENLKDIIRATIKNGNPLNFGIVDYGDYVKIILTEGTYYVSKIDYLRMMTDILDVKVKVKH